MYAALVQVWVHVDGSETFPQNRRSFANLEEVDAVCRVVATLRERDPGGTIAVLTFYKTQMVELMKVQTPRIPNKLYTVWPLLLWFLRAKAENAPAIEFSWVGGSTQALNVRLNVTVQTVDACQGSEFEYVVLSTVRSNRKQGQAGIGFVASKQRINVAISRAQRKLVVVGDRRTMQRDPDWEEIHKCCMRTRCTPGNAHKISAECLDA